MFNTTDIPKSSRIPKLVEALYAHMPVIESARAKLITESYKATEGQPTITRRAEAFAHILRNIPIIIRDNELIVGSSTIAPRGCQTFPEFSYQWLEDELDTVATRTADPFYIAEETKQELREVHKYWKGKTSHELYLNMLPRETRRVIYGDEEYATQGLIFDEANNAHTLSWTGSYEKVIREGLESIIRELEEKKAGIEGNLLHNQMDKIYYLDAAILSCKAMITYALSLIHI